MTETEEKKFVCLPDVREAFPNLHPENFRVTSPETGRYNCVAWAMNDKNKWWWPDAYDMGFWPDGIEREERIANFVELFESMGFVQCESDKYDNNYEKIAIYKDKDGFPTHVARQLDQIFWTSKLGEKIDISHTLNALFGPVYGEIAVFMKRGIQ